MKIFNVDVKDIRKKAGEERYFDITGDVGKVEIREQEIDLRDINIKGVAQNISEGILLKAKAAGTLILRCDRCIDKFKQSLNLEIKEFYSFKDKEADHFLAENFIDTSKLIVELLALNLDFKILCKKNCAGLCPSCGINLNKKNCNCEKKLINIKWRKLKELKKRMK